MQQVAYNATTRVATVQTKGDALPVGSTKLIEYDHDAVDVEDNDENPGGKNHVHFHHIRDALYHLGVEDMSTVTILMDETYLALVSLDVTPAAVSKVVGQTQQLTVAYTPTGASNKAVAYSTSDATKATVSASGLVTAVAAGVATITVTSDDGAKVDTCVFTVTAV